MSEATRNPVSPSNLLTSKLDALRRRQFSVAAGGGLARLVLALLALLAAGMYLDWKIELSKEGRTLLLLLDLAIALHILIKYLYRPHVNRPDDDEAALYIEHSRPEFQSRLIAATQLTRPGAIPPGASPALVSELVKRAEKQAKPVDFADEVPTDTVRNLVCGAILFTFIWGYAFNQGGQDARDLLSRAFLSDIPVPRDTHIASVTHKEIIPRGDDILITAKIDADNSEVIPDEGTLVLDYGRGSDHKIKAYKAERVWTDIKKKHLDGYDGDKNGKLNKEELSLIKDQDRIAIISAGFAEVLEDGNLELPEADLKHEFRFYVSAARARRDFEFDVRLNDGREDGEVQVVARPMVQFLDCAQTLPQYLNPERKSEKREKDNLRLLEGSDLKVVITTNKKEVSGELIFTDGSAITNITLSSIGERKLAANITLDRHSITGFRVKLVDKHNFKNVSNVEYAITVLADTPPFVEITGRERREETVTSRATVPVAFRARDNYRLKTLSLNWEIEDTDADAPLEGAIPINAPNLGTEITDLTALNLTEHIAKKHPNVPLIGKRVAFWVEATDYDEKNKPSRSQPPFIAVVVTDDEKNNELLLRTGDSIGRIGDTTGNQEQLNERLREILARRFRNVPDPTNAPPDKSTPPKR